MASQQLRKGDVYDLRTGRVERAANGPVRPSERPYVGARGNDLRAVLSGAHRVA